MLKVVNKTCIGDVELLAVDHEKLDLVGRGDICHWCKIIHTWVKFHNSIEIIEFCL